MWFLNDNDLGDLPIVPWSLPFSSTVSACSTIRREEHRFNCAIRTPCWVLCRRPGLSRLSYRPHSQTLARTELL